MVRLKELYVLMDIFDVIYSNLYSKFQGSVKVVLTLSCPRRLPLTSKIVWR